MNTYFCKRPLIALGIFVVLIFPYQALAQTSQPITASGLNTQVSVPILIGGKTQFDITGGTRAGTNLFHSFGDFNVPNDNIANFLNNTGLATDNILGRVTGGNASTIFGTIQTTGFENANLFLMNPSGIVFGPNASLNVGGSVTFTTANYLRFADNGQFNAGPNVAADALLSTAPVTAYGFLRSTPGDITVRGSQFTVMEDNSISLVGGNVTVESSSADGTLRPALLTAPGGQINLASFSSPGEASYSTLQSAPMVNVQSFTNMGTINLSKDTKLNVSDDAAGTIRIRGGNLVMDNASLSANSLHSDGATIAINIDVTDQLTISTNQAPAITARASGSGNAGEIKLTSSKMDVAYAFPEKGVVIDSSTTGSGNAGKVTMTTGEFTAIDTSSGFGVFIDSGTGGTGNGGDITIQVRRGEFIGANINTGDAFFFGTGSAGDLRIGGLEGMSDSLHFVSLVLSTEAFSARAGTITLEGRDISIKNNSFVSSISLQGENPITINAERLSMDNVVRVQAQTRNGNGGDITFTGNRLEMSNESAFITNTTGDGNAGTIRVNARELVRLSDNPLTPTPSGLFTNSIGREGVTTSGNAGAVQVITPRLEMAGGARLSTTTRTAGRGGDVTVTALSDGIFISGQRAGDPPLENFGLGGSDGSGIFTRTIGTVQCGGTCGRSGNQVIAAGHLALRNGGILDSGTTGNGNGGDIHITASKDIVLSGTTNDGTPSGIFSRTIGQSSDAGFGGNISLKAGQSVTIQDGASISARSTGPADADKIFIDAGQQLDVRDSSITTEALRASGGNIDIRAIDRVRLVNSPISSSVQGGPNTTGGNITIDPKVVVLHNSDILAQARQGNGGNITITTPLFLADQTSLVDASSQFGLSGTVTIQSPTSNLSETVTQLPSKPSATAALLQNRCIALAGGEQSTFVLASRDALPSEPGGWLSSPVSMERWMGEDTEHATGLIAGTRKLNESRATIVRVAQGEVLSLRRLTPPGFLVRTFATGTTGCPS